MCEIIDPFCIKSIEIGEMIISPAFHTCIVYWIEFSYNFTFDKVKSSLLICNLLNEGLISLPNLLIVQVIIAVEPIKMLSGLIVMMGSWGNRNERKNKWSNCL